MAEKGPESGGGEHRRLPLLQRKTWGLLLLPPARKEKGAARPGSFRLHDQAPLQQLGARPGALRPAPAVPGADVAIRGSRQREQLEEVTGRVLADAAGSRRRGHRVGGGHERIEAVSRFQDAQVRGDGVEHPVDDADHIQQLFSHDAPVRQARDQVPFRPPVGDLSGVPVKIETGPAPSQVPGAGMMGVSFRVQAEGAEHALGLGRQEGETVTPPGACGFQGVEAPGQPGTQRVGTLQVVGEPEHARGHPRLHFLAPGEPQQLVAPGGTEGLVSFGECFFRNEHAVPRFAAPDRDHRLDVETFFDHALRIPGAGDEKPHQQVGVQVDEEPAGRCELRRGASHQFPDFLFEPRVLVAVGAPIRQRGQHQGGDRLGPARSLRQARRPGRIPRRRTPRQQPLEGGHHGLSRNRAGGRPDPGRGPGHLVGGRALLAENQQGCGRVAAGGQDEVPPGFSLHDFLAGSCGKV